MNDVKRLQQDLSKALQVEQAHGKEAEDVQSMYDSKFKEFEAQNKELIDEKLRADTLKQLSKGTVKDLKEEVRKLLSSGFIDDLPEGFIQKKTIEVMYDKRDMRKAALDHFHHLLVLDEKAVDKFVKDNLEKPKGTDGVYVSDIIFDFIRVLTFYKPLPNISNATLLKLDTEPIIE